MYRAWVKTHTQSVPLITPVFIATIHVHDTQSDLQLTNGEPSLLLYCTYCSKNKKHLRGSTQAPTHT